MEILMELLWGLLEMVLYVLLEGGIEWGMHNSPPPFRQERFDPWWAAVGYFLAGVLLGAISLTIFPSSFISSHGGRVANLLITPVLAGVTMAALGAWRQRHGQTLVRIDRFLYGFLFAVGLSLTRFLWIET